MALTETDLYFSNPYKEWDRLQLENELVEIEAERIDAQTHGLSDRLDVINDHRVWILSALGVRVLPVPYYEGTL